MELIFITGANTAKTVKISFDGRNRGSVDLPDDARNLSLVIPGKSRMNINPFGLGFTESVAAKNGVFPIELGRKQVSVFGVIVFNEPNGGALYRLTTKKADPSPPAPSRRK